MESPATREREMRVVTATLATAALAVPCHARAQEELAPPPPDAWGTSWTTTTTVGAWSFAGPMTDAGNGFRNCAAATGACRGAVSGVATGAWVWNLEIDACDSSPAEEAVAQLWGCGPAPGPGACFVIAEVHSGIAAAEGCRRYRFNLAQPFTANNYNYTYFVDVFGTNGTGNVPAVFRAVRLNWLRQVSPAPATATFGDVPTTHPYFRHVEALAASLISGGCGGGQFCPDRAVTRGEMAVFLSVALGLNFPD